MKNLSIRRRVAFLVVVAALPAFLLSLYSGIERRLEAQSYARAELQRHARLAAERLQQTTEGARQLLLAIAAASSAFVEDPRACQQFFSRMVAGSNGLYQAMGMHTADGRVHCSSTTLEGVERGNQPRYFRLAAETGRFAIGEYQVAGVSGSRSINFGLPISDGEKRLRAVVFAGLSLPKLSELTAATPLPGSGLLVIADHTGRILVRHPEGGVPVRDEALSADILEAMGSTDGVFEATDGNGVARLYAVERVQSDARGRGALNVVVSMPRQAVYSDANRATFRMVAGIVVAAGLLLFCAWYGPEYAVLGRLRALLAVTSHIRAGDLTARTNFPPSDEEICQIGHALDDMAQALQKRDADLKQALRELSEQVITDPLTRLNNRRYLWDFLGRDLIRARRAVLPVAAILFDIDHFKRFNDTWGHEAGDLVLKSAADVIRQNVRGSDIACRYGGEEFIVVLPEATRNVAVERAETIRRDIERMELVLGDKKLDRVTASFGVALFPTHADTAEALVRAADDALYRAKENGRNRVHVFETAPSLL